MASKNLSILIGNLGRDPEMRYTPTGKAVTTMSVATNLKWQGADGQPQVRTDWHNIEAWGRLAETCAQYLKKGSTVYVEGRIQYDVVGEGDARRKYTKIVAKEVQFLDRNGDTVTATADEQAPEDQAEEEIPF